MAARRMFYDTLVYDQTALRFLVDSFGLGQLMVGSWHESHRSTE